LEASIILVIYNGMQYLPECLRSLGSELNGDCELILIDNASSDSSSEYVRTQYPQVCLVQNTRNVGFAAACNQGARLAQGDFFIFLNQDTRVCPGWLKGLLEPFSGCQAVGLSTSKLVVMSSPEKIHTCGQDIHFSGLTFGRGLLQPAACCQRGGPVGAVSGASFAIRSELWKHLGGLDEQLFMYYEETDLSWRAWLAGFACFYTPASMLYHDYRLKSSASALYYSARNRWVLLLKYWRIPTFFLLAPGLLLAELVDWGVSALNGRAGISAKLKSAGWLVRNLPAIWRSRRTSRSSRKKPDWFLLEHCTSTLRPKVLTGGLVGKLIVCLVNVLFWLNYQAASFVEKRLNI